MIKYQLLHCLNEIAMELKRYSIRNFRRLEDVTIDLHGKETVFVGPNNSGKTSAAIAFKYFFGKASVFTIFEYSSSKFDFIDQYGKSRHLEDDEFPAIEMDLWFSVNPEIEYGRVAGLLTSMSLTNSEIGIRISLQVKDVSELRDRYLAMYPEEGSLRKSLTQYLAMNGNFSRHFQLVYASLEIVNGVELVSMLDSEKAPSILRSLLRIDYVDAQRNINDHEQGRSNKLSSAFAAFHKSNLQQKEVNQAATQVIDDNNASLTEHYADTFAGLLKMIGGLGVPGVNDRDLKILSTLSPESALKGNTELHYIDAVSQHELPEAYNGLGFKNLIYIAIQINHFHLQWLRTKERRPLCQIILIEEPEVHLHAQVQQTFVENIWELAELVANDSGEPSSIPQFILTTHSSHIVDGVAFEKIRYFRRCRSDVNTGNVVGRVASKVLSLAKIPSPDTQPEQEDEADNIKFLKKYLRLAHCDLFFSDGVILVEGAAEKLLLPQMIEKVSPALRSRYVTILEVGGAYAYRFANVLDFIEVPYLIITDLDSVDPAKNRKTCRADTNGAATSNKTISEFTGRTLISDLHLQSSLDRVFSKSLCFLAYQFPTPVREYGDDKVMAGRTFEDTFSYENIGHFREKNISNCLTVDNELNFEEDYTRVFDAVHKKKFKKTEFALDLIFTDIDWDVPPYIKEGLAWLECQVC